MRVLITGGFGFIGGRLARHLQSCGHEIVLGSTNLRSAPHWLPDAKVVRTMWADESELLRACSSVDAVIHTAGMNAQDCASSPAAALAFNGEATGRLADAAGRACVKRFIYFSTAHVYGAPLAGEIVEETTTRNTHPYATSHLAGEEAAIDAATRYGTKSFILRVSNVFGAPVDSSVNCWMLLVNDLCRQAVATQRLKLFSSGLQRRDFIPMTELVKVVGVLLGEPGSSICSGIMNLGTGESTSVLKMAERIQDQCLVTLGFKPELQRQEHGTQEAATLLNYRIDCLRKCGISIDSSPDLEISNLLRFCHTNFSPQGRAD